LSRRFQSNAIAEGRFYVHEPTRKLWTAEMFDSVFTSIPVNADPATVTAQVDFWQIFKNGRLA
jgi:hypothetical protein